MAETAESVMERAVITVSPETSLLDVHRLFAEEQIHGAPVVDDREVIVGVVSASDLIRAVAEEHDSATGDAQYFRELVEYSGPDWGAGAEDFQDRLAQTTVNDVMTPLAVVVDRQTPIPGVARTLRENRIHRVYVADEGRLCGVISTFDLLPLLEGA